MTDTIAGSASHRPPDGPYYDRPIIGFFKSSGRQFRQTFSGMAEAVAGTGISAGYIRRCIDEGIKWRCWTFDLA